MTIYKTIRNSVKKSIVETQFSSAMSNDIDMMCFRKRIYRPIATIDFPLSYVW